MGFKMNGVAEVTYPVPYVGPDIPYGHLAELVEDSKEMQDLVCQADPGISFVGRDGKQYYLETDQSGVYPVWKLTEIK